MLRPSRPSVWLALAQRAGLRAGVLALRPLWPSVWLARAQRVQLRVGQAVGWELLVARSLMMPMALPRLGLMAARAALTASALAAPMVLMMASVLSMTELSARRMRSFPAGLTVPEQLIAASR